MRIKAFTKNQKTVVSVDFDRDSTCPQICDYCYVENMERIYQAYADKIKRNDSWSREKPENFARQLNTEYRKLRKSKAKSNEGLEKLPVRIYGSGDYIPEHYEWLKHLDFKFYIISKSLTFPRFDEERQKLLGLPNLTNIVLSFDNQNIDNYDHVKHLYKTDRFQFAFTGENFDWQLQTEFNDREFGIFFNTGRKNSDEEFSAKVKQSCPTDAGKLDLQKACTKCNKCWRSSKTKGKDWNEVAYA